MTQAFRRTVTDLWQLAELGLPRFAQDGSASLNFDEVDLRLTLSPTEQDVLIRADAGQMTQSLANDAERLQRILGLSFALLATHDVLLSLDDDRVVISASYPLQADNLDHLAGLLSDVVSATQTIAAQLDAAGAGLRPVSARAHTPDSMMIFQP